jgi:hypothetical protein
MKKYYIVKGNLQSGHPYIDSQWNTLRDARKAKMKLCRLFPKDKVFIVKVSEEIIQ